MGILIFSFDDFAAGEFGFELQVDCALGFGEPPKDLPFGWLSEGLADLPLQVVDEQPHPFVAALVQSPSHSLTVDDLGEHCLILEKGLLLLRP